MKRTAQSIEAKKTLPVEGKRKTKGIGRGNSPNSRKNLKTTGFPKGVSGNPGGLPGTDLSAVYARRFFEQHPEGISESLWDDLKGSNAYAYNVLADRGYGKVKEIAKIEHSGEMTITIKMVKTEE
jgi:hypothetical protein